MPGNLPDNYVDSVPEIFRYVAIPLEQAGKSVVYIPYQRIKFLGIMSINHARLCIYNKL